MNHNFIPAQRKKVNCLNPFAPPPNFFEKKMLSDAEQETMSVSEDEQECTEKELTEHFYHFVDLETHRIDVNKIPKEVREGMPKSALFHPYHPEILEKIAEEEPGVAKALPEYMKRGVEFPDNHMVVDWLSGYENGLGRWQSNAFLGQPEFGFKTKNMSLATMKRIFSHTILQQYDYYDVDIRSCRLSIFNNFVQFSSKYTEDERRCLQSFLDNRDEWFADFVKDLKAVNLPAGTVPFTKDHAKELLVACTNGGDLNWAIQKMRDGKSRQNVWNDKYKKFFQEEVENGPKVALRKDSVIVKSKSYLKLKAVCDLMDKVSDNLYSANSTFDVFFDYKAKVDQFEQEHGTNTEKAAVWTEHWIPKIKLALSSHIYQLMECMAIYRVFFLKSDSICTHLCNPFTMVYSFDGVAVQLRPDVTIEEFMETVNDFASMGNLTFVNKPWMPLDEEWVIPEDQLANLPWSQEEVNALLEDAKQRGEETKERASKKRKADEMAKEELDAQYHAAYKAWKVEFEKEFCKIINLACFVREYRNEKGGIEMIYFKASQLESMFQEYGAMKLRNNIPVYMPFVSEWFKDPKIRKYDCMKAIPPPLTCPPNIFNLWRPSKYAAQEIHSGEEGWNAAALEMFRNHIRTLLDHEEAIEYMENFIAHMLQRFAEKPEVLLTLISNQGAGKTKFTEVLEQLVGEEVTLTTTRPEVDVWGSFNGMMANRFLIILNECSKKNSFGATDQIKGLITDKRMTLNPKGVGQFTIDSYHRFILCTNHPDPVEVSEDDRRNVVIRCSNVLRGNTAYFNEFQKLVFSTSGLQTIYWYYNTRDISAWDFRDKPRTSYQQLLVSVSAEDLYERFVGYVVYEFSNQPQADPSTLTLNRDETLAKFEQFAAAERIKDTSITFQTINKKMFLNEKFDGAFVKKKKGCYEVTWNMTKLRSILGLKEPDPAPVAAAPSSRPPTDFSMYTSSSALN